MTVEDLIQFLSKFDPKTLVVREAPNNGYREIYPYEDTLELTGSGYMYDPDSDLPKTSRLIKVIVISS